MALPGDPTKKSAHDRILAEDAMRRQRELEEKNRNKENQP